LAPHAFRSILVSQTPSPRATLLLLAYRQEETVSEALRSCLAQRCEPLDIICSDDSSADGTYRVMRQEAARYSGPHRVTVRRNDATLGIAGHYNHLIAHSSGELLITAAGDDISEPDRVARLLQAWDAGGRRADLVASHVIDISRRGAVKGVLKVDDLASYASVGDWIRRRPYVIGAGPAFTRRMMRRFGPLDPRVHYEDQIMVFRAIASGGAITVDAPLVRYRRGGQSARRRFKAATELTAWRQRRLHQEIAEREQLIRDARVAGCERDVAEALDDLRLRQLYMQRLDAAGSAKERWLALREARQVPATWRIRKWLQASFPTLRV
jgi:glycosyltransferase involved in cell wall biosynthesis